MCDNSPSHGSRNTQMASIKIRWYGISSNYLPKYAKPSLQRTISSANVYTRIFRWRTAGFRRNDAFGCSQLKFSLVDLVVMASWFKKPFTSFLWLLLLGCFLIGEVNKHTCIYCFLSGFCWFSLTTIWLSISNVLE